MHTVSDGVETGMAELWKILEMKILGWSVWFRTGQTILHVRTASAEMASTEMGDNDSGN